MIVRGAVLREMATSTRASIVSLPGTGVRQVVLL
jgi:hypothetical protein